MPSTLYSENLGQPDSNEVDIVTVHSDQTVRVGGFGHFVGRMQTAVCWRRSSQLDPYALLVSQGLLEAVHHGNCRNMLVC